MRKRPNWLRAQLRWLAEMYLKPLFETRFERTAK